MKRATCSAQVARERLGFAPTRTLDESLDDIVNYIRTRGPRPFDYAFDLEIVTDQTPRTWRDRLL